MLISVTFTILSATTTEVTIKGLVSLFLAVLALTIGVRSQIHPAQSVRASSIHVRRGLLESESSSSSWRLVGVRLLVGTIVFGITLAITTGTMIATVLGRILDRLG